MTKRHAISFLHAFEGLIHALKSQPNFFFHTLVTLAVITAALVLKVTSIEWAILTLTITIGLALELINTSVESTVDLITTEWKIEAKIAKDTAAGAMLVYAVGATIVALIIFLPKLLNSLIG